MLLVLLQNAWSIYYERIARPGEIRGPDDYYRAVENRVWARENWLKATWASRSGKRLKRILEGVPDDIYWMDNTTLEVADKSSGVKAPDLDHIREVLHERHITMVLACGKQSCSAIDKVWRGSVLMIPHPACRVITNDACKGYNAILHVMLVRFTRRHLCRVAMDTHGEKVHPLPRDEEPFDESPWILPGQHDQEGDL